MEFKEPLITLSADDSEQAFCLNSIMDYHLPGLPFDSLRRRSVQAARESFFFYKTVNATTSQNSNNPCRPQ